MATTIKLSRGQFAIVDDEDAARVQEFKWCVGDHPSCGRSYPVPTRRIATPVVRYQSLAEFILGRQPGKEINYQDGNSFNCTKSNLRYGTRSMNWGNRRKLSKCLSIYKGVSWRKDRKRWKAYAQINGVLTNLGNFTDENEAGRAYNQKAAEIFGEFARLNVVPKGPGRRHP